MHRCGRCQAEFTALEDFVQHKIQKACQWAPQEALPTSPATTLLGQEVVPMAGEAGPEEPITVAHIVVEATSPAADINHAPDLVGKPIVHRWPSVLSIPDLMVSCSQGR